MSLAVPDEHKAPRRHLYDRATSRGLRRARLFGDLSDPGTSPMPLWGAEGLPNAYLAGLLVRDRRTRWRIRRNRATGERERVQGMATPLDSRELTSLAAELRALAILAYGGRRGGTIVTGSFQLWQTIARQHPTWKPSGDANADRDNYWPRVSGHLTILERLGLIYRRVDLDSEGVERRMVIELREPPALDEEELAAGAAALKARQARYGRSLRTTSTRSIPLTAARPLSGTAVKERGVKRRLERAAARRRPVAAGDPTDTAHPLGTATSGGTALESSKRSSRDRPVTNPRTRGHAHDATNARGRRIGHSALGTGLSETAASRRAGLVPQSGRAAVSGALGLPERPYGSAMGSGGLDVSRYLQRLDRWLSDPIGMIPHPGFPSMTERELQLAGWRAAYAAYRAASERHPDRCRFERAIADRRRRNADLAETVASKPLLEATAYELRRTWAYHRHDQVNAHTAAALYDSGVLTSDNLAELRRAVGLYERHAEHRPAWLPEDPGHALWRIAELAQAGLLHPFRPNVGTARTRWLADGIRRLLQEARDMRAASRRHDPQHYERQRRRALRRRRRVADEILAAVQQFTSTTPKIAYRLTIRPPGLPTQGRRMVARDQRLWRREELDPYTDGSWLRLAHKAGLTSWPRSGAEAERDALTQTPVPSHGTRLPLPHTWTRSPVDHVLRALSHRTNTPIRWLRQLDRGTLERRLTSAEQADIEARQAESPIRLTMGNPPLRPVDGSADARGQSVAGGGRTAQGRPILTPAEYKALSDRKLQDNRDTPQDPPPSPKR